MATAVHLEGDYDNTELRRVVRGSLTLALIQALLVVVVSVINKSLDGTIDHLLTGIVVFIGAMITIFYPGTLTRPRTIEGIAGAAGVGLGATWIFLLLDAFLLQTFHVYTNRWREIGGGSIWWYLPVWWMVGTYLSWMGGWILANQANKSGESSVPSAVVLVTITSAVCGAIATLAHFPGAGWNVPTFAVAVLPGLVVANVVSAFGSRRG
jgi:uncharacterized membrane protein YgdD (TMEM256/DUF423 family)